MANPTNPFAELEETFERMQEDFEERARGWNGERFGLATPSTVRVDLKDEEETYVLTAELPGFEKDDVDVRITDRTLHLSAERETESESEVEEDGEYIRKERHQAAVSRSIQLPKSVDRSESTASFSNGILTVHLPKTEPSVDGKEIEVQ